MKSGNLPSPTCTVQGCIYYRGGRYWPIGAAFACKFSLVMAILSHHGLLLFCRVPIHQSKIWRKRGYLCVHIVVDLHVGTNFITSFFIPFKKIFGLFICSFEATLCGFLFWFFSNLYYSVLEMIFLYSNSLLFMKMKYKCSPPPPGQSAVTHFCRV